MKSKIPTILLIVAAFSGHAVAATYFLGISGAGAGGSNPPDASTLYQLDPSTGAIVRTIGSTGVRGITALAFNPATKTLYGYKSDGNSTPNVFELYSLSLASGAAALIGSPGNTDFNAIPDMAVQPGTNLLFGWTENSDDLVLINTATAALTPIGDSGISTEQTGLSFTPTGKLYVKTAESLIALSPTTGLQTEPTVTITSSGALDLDNLLTFNPAGVMYVADRGGAGTSETKIFAGSAATGVVAQVGTAAARLSAFTFLSVAAPQTKVKGKKKITLGSAKKSVKIRGTIASDLPIAKATIKAGGSKPKSLKVSSNGSFVAKIKVAPTKKRVKVTISAEDAFGAQAPRITVKIVRS